MQTRCADCRRAVTTTHESARVLHSKATRPASSNLDSASPRTSTDDASPRTLYASARTRSPRSANFTYVGSNHAGGVFNNAPTASGEPLTNETGVAAPSAPLTSATTAIRWSADEKWKRLKMRTVLGLNGSGARFRPPSIFFPESRFFSGGVAVAVAASYVQPSADTAFSSISSPTNLAPSSPPSATNAWHAASTTAAAAGASATSASSRGAASSGWASTPTTPAGTNRSVVSVPVLSKRQCFRRPANGTRYGSMAMIPDFISAMSAVLTASAICIGNCRGTTDVTMMTHRSNSSCVVRSPFFRPSRKT
mmetsp:Transcript_3236/g.9930  ORF Transcript_3236/g.9930 Transcript_3236/m.9930 type:complete len:309 (-) Transcript_3236:1078-2004(-)